MSDIWQSERRLMMLLYRAAYTSNDDSCPICLTEYEEGDEIIKLNECGHVFHKHCIRDHLDFERRLYSDVRRQKGEPIHKCPKCRHSLNRRSYISNKHTDNDKTGVTHYEPPTKLAQPSVSDSVQQAVEAEGLVLVKSIESKTGFKNVRKHPQRNKFVLESKRFNGHMGTFNTAEEAALEYARRLGPVLSREEAEKEDTTAEARSNKRKRDHMTAEQVTAAAEEEDLVLVRTTNNKTGYKNVHPKDNRYVVQTRDPSITVMGTHGTPEEAALWYARQLGPERSRQEQENEYLIRDKSDLDQRAQNARDEAAAEGLILEKNNSDTGYKYVYKQKQKFSAVLRHGGRKEPIVKNLGNFHTPEEAALAVARHLHT